MATMKEMCMQEKMEKAKRFNIKVSIIIGSIFILLSVIFIIIGIPAMIASAALVMMDAFIVLILIYGIRTGSMPGTSGSRRAGMSYGIDVDANKSPIHFGLLFAFYTLTAIATFIAACIFTTAYFFGF